MPQKSMSHTELTNSLAKYTPHKAAMIFADWILHYHIHVKIKRETKTVNGDYRPPQRGRGHIISMNASLNPYQFAITFAHEIAHLMVWDQFQNKVAPHGKEWKLQFGKLLGLLLKEDIFPEDLIVPIQTHQKKASCF